MSHIAVRIVGDWLKDVTFGVNATAALVPLLSGDSAPASVSVYEETTDKWVARRRVPDAADATAAIAFPLIVVALNDAAFDGSSGRRTASGVVANGEVRVLVQIYLHAADTADGFRDVMYMQRAIRGSLMQLDNAAQSSRTQCNTALFPSTAISQPPVPPHLGDLVCAGSTIVTYPVWESTPLTS